MKKGHARAESSTPLKYSTPPKYKSSSSTGPLKKQLEYNGCLDVCDMLIEHADMHKKAEKIGITQNQGWMADCKGHIEKINLFFSSKCDGIEVECGPMYNPTSKESGFMVNFYGEIIIDSRLNDWKSNSDTQYLKKQLINNNCFHITRYAY